MGKNKNKQTKATSLTNPPYPSNRVSQSQISASSRSRNSAITDMDPLFSGGSNEELKILINGLSKKMDTFEETLRRMERKLEELSVSVFYFDFFSFRVFNFILLFFVSGTSSNYNPSS